MTTCHGCEVAGYNLKIGGTEVVTYTPPNPPLPNGWVAQHTWNPANGPVVSFIQTTPDGTVISITNMAITSLDITLKSGSCKRNDAGVCVQDTGCTATLGEVWCQEVKPDGTFGPPQILMFGPGMYGDAITTPPGVCGGGPVGLANYRFDYMGAPSYQTIEFSVACADCCDDNENDPGGGDD